MRLLILAQTPPPLHGQSLMVQRAVAALPGYGIEVEQVNLSLSRTAEEIGRWKGGKLLRALRCALKARRQVRRTHCDALYYVPAPGKRISLWRDLLVLGLVRPVCPRLILHWHAPGLGAWLEEQAVSWERARARQVLGGADLSLVLTESLAGDAAYFAPKRQEVLPNGVPDPWVSDEPRPPRRGGGPLRLFHLGLCCEAKGTFLLIEAFRRLLVQGWDVELMLAGAVPDAATRERLRDHCAELKGRLFWSGFAAGERLENLWAAADLLCFPSCYPHEGQPLVLLEAMARDLPVAAMDWRGVGESLPPGTALAKPGDLSSYTELLGRLLGHRRGDGGQRAHYLAYHTLQGHLDRLARLVGGLV